jgi:hypothetical protein
MFLSNIDLTDDKLGADVPKECIEGGEAFAKGIKVDDNPYPKDTQQHQDWELGWCNAEGYDQFTKGEIP